MKKLLLIWVLLDPHVLPVGDERPGPLHVTGEQPVDERSVVDVRRVLQLWCRRSAAPVVGVGVERDRLVGEGGEHVRAGANGGLVEVRERVRHLGPDVLRQDDLLQHAVFLGEHRAAEGDGDVGAADYGVLDVERVGVRGLVGANELERVRDVRCGERLAVRPLDAVTSGERHRGVVVAPLVGGSEPRHRVGGRVVVGLHEGLVDRPGVAGLVAGGVGRERVGVVGQLTIWHGHRQRDGALGHGGIATRRLRRRRLVVTAVGATGDRECCGNAERNGRD